MNYGKFRSVEELLKGYAELEKSYTQKCQQLSALQKQTQGTNENSSPLQSPVTKQAQNEQSPHEAVTQLLEGTNENSSPSVTATKMQGETHVELPKTFAEASKDALFALQKQLGATSAQTPPQQPVVDTIPEGKPPINDTPTNEQLQQYLMDNPTLALKLLQSAKIVTAPPIIGGGGNLSLAVPSKPRTLKEATILAKDLFK